MIRSSCPDSATHHQRWRIFQIRSKIKLTRRTRQMEAPGEDFLLGSVEFRTLDRRWSLDGIMSRLNMPDSPINKLRSLAELGNQQARDLINRYAELENLTKEHGEMGGVANLRAEFLPQFESMANLIEALAKITVSPQDFDISLERITEMDRISYDTLQEKMNARIRLLNMSIIRDAQVNAAYISNGSQLNQ